MAADLCGINHATAKQHCSALSSYSKTRCAKLQLHMTKAQWAILEAEGIVPYRCLCEVLRAHLKWRRLTSIHVEKIFFKREMMFFCFVFNFLIKKEKKKKLKKRKNVFTSHIIFRGSDAKLHC